MAIAFVAVGLTASAIGAGPALVVLLLIPVVLWVATTKARREHSEYTRLTALDREDRRQAELQRLRSKYDR